MKRLKGFIFLITVFSMISWTTAGWTAEVLIGYTGPLSGPAAEYGQDCVTGLDMAINELNAAGGITVEGHKLLFRLEKLDSKVDPTVAMKNARQFLDHNALAIYDSVFNTQSVLAKMNEEECNEFLLMGFTTSPKATQTGNKLLIIMSTPLTGYCQIFADYAWEKGWRKAAIVVTLGAYGDDWREAFKNYWKKLGGTITADKPANYYTKTDFTAPLAVAVATNPDVMLIGGPSSTTALVIEQARNMGYKGGFMLIDQARMDYVSTMLEGTSMMEGVIGLPTLDASLSALVPAFDKKYRSIYKRPAAWETIVHYGSIFYLAAAIQAANTIDDVYAIRDALPRVFPMTGERFPFEVYGISSTGRVYTAYSVQTVQNGKFIPASEVYVWWTKNQAELDKLQKITKYKIPLKRIKEKIGKIE